VTGIDADGIGYTVRVYPRPVGAPNAVGVAEGSMNIMTLLTVNEGQPVNITPTGPTITLDVNSPAAVLAALQTMTDVVSVEGDDVPELLGTDDQQDNVVY
jgi:hypothetical protein